MNRRFFISVAFIFAALSLANCQREPAVQPVTEADKTIPSYHVPREKALAELNSFLADVDANNTTRGGKIRQIKDVTPILGDKFQNTTRVSEDEAAAAIDTLLYLVNFEDEEGYAVLSAADFLAPIIAVMDQGSIDSSMIENVAGTIWDFDDDDCCIDYYEDELEEEEADTTDLPIIGDPINPPLIGGLSSQSNEITRTSESSSAVNHTLKFVLRTVNDYCEYKLIERNNTGGSGDNSGGSGNNSGDEGSGNGGSTSPQDWVTISQVEPMLQSQWAQFYPFNANCPTKPIEDTVYNGHAPAGCVAVAVGQLLAYHQYPSQVGDLMPLWPAIRLIQYPCIDQPVLLGIAPLLAELGKNNFLSMTYTKKKGKSNAYRAAKTLKKLGYLNAQRVKYYNENTILEYLETDRPIIIGATSPKNLSGTGKRSGHAWVIDGYIKRQRDNQIETMMHCNMGWGGECDGYYVSGLFDTTQVKDAQGNPTDGDGAENKHHYCKRYRMVLYDKPLILQ
ncbi:MAG: C10 family peptidase [Rikenellaceae bacterium]|nr:C10 family peptidase [Rikenellaceae bacterium]